MTAVGGLLVGLAALVTAIGSLRRASSAKSAVDQLRIDLTQKIEQRANLMQAPTINNFLMNGTTTSGPAVLQSQPTAEPTESLPPPTPRQPRSASSKPRRAKNQRS